MTFDVETGGFSPQVGPDGRRGGGGGTSLNPQIVHVSPLGKDTNDGLTWAKPFKTGYKAFAYLQSVKGGIMKLANGCTWVDNANLHSGQVADQGAWFTGFNGYAPGFQYSQWPVKIIGEGSIDSAADVTSFQRPGTVFLYGGSNRPTDFRRKPGIYNVQCVISPEWHNVELRPYPGAENGASCNYYSIRDGWDYNRLADGSPMALTVSSSTRAAGSSTHTVTLSPSAIVTSAKRVSGVTTLTIHGNTSGLNIAAPPWSIGTKIWFQSTSGSFTSGAYTTLSVNATQLGLNDWSITFTDPGPDVGPTANPGGVTSVIATVGDLIDLESTSAQFPSCPYLVTATTVTGINSGTITVADNFAGAGPIVDGTVANIGHLVHQCREYYCSVASRYYKANTRAPITDTFDDAFLRWGPGVDVGCTTAFPQEFHEGYFEGYKPSVASGLSAYYDPLRMSSNFVMGGPVTSPGFKARQCTGSKATWYFVSAGSGNQALFDLNGWLTDCPNGEAPACYNINGSNATDVYIYQVIAADFNVGFGPALNTIVGIQPLKLRGDSSSLGPWASVAPAGDTTSGFGIKTLGALTPWAYRQPATWTDDLQVSGLHPAAWRQISPVSRRFQDYAYDPANYTPGPPNVTGIDDPNGGTAANRWIGAGAIFPHSFNNPFTFLPGDRILVCGWIRGDARVNPAILFSLIALGGGVVWSKVKDSATPNIHSYAPPLPVTADGWQFISTYDMVESAGGACHLQVNITGSAGNTDLFGWSVYYLPAATVNEADASEFSGTLRAVPIFLPVGHAGTHPNQPFHAEGGLGISSTIMRTVGAGSGQLTLGATVGYEPRFNTDGTIIGWIPVTAATINP